MVRVTCFNSYSFSSKYLSLLYFRKISVIGLSIPLLAPVVQKLRDNARVSLILIRWIVIYPVDIAIQRLNNRGLEVTLVFCKSPPTHPLSGTELKLN